MTIDEYKNIKALTKKNSTKFIARKGKWSERTIARVKQSTSFKNYKDLCVSY